MDDKETIVVIDQDGQEREAEVISNFALPDTGKEYIFYTFDERDANGMVKLYASVLVEKDGMFSFEDIESDEEWSKIKDIMKKMVQDANTRFGGDENNE